MSWDFTVLVGNKTFAGNCEAATPSEALDKAEQYVSKFGISPLQITKIDASPKEQNG